MKIPRKIRDVFESEKYHQLATSTRSGIPNLCTFGAKYLIDDEIIIIVDNYFRKTLKNILSNPEVSILIRRDKECYQIKGKAEYKTKGKLYEEAKFWMKSRGDHYPAKGIVIIRPEAFYNSISGLGAGKEFV